MKLLKLVSLESSPQQAKKLEEANSSIEEESDDEDHHHERNNNPSIANFERGTKVTTENTGLVTQVGQERQASPGKKKRKSRWSLRTKSEITLPDHLYTLPRRASQALSVKSDWTLSDTERNSGTHMRRMGVYKPKSLTPQQMYFLDNRLLTTILHNGSKFAQRRASTGKKFINVVANAVKKNNNSPYAKKLYEILVLFLFYFV